MFRTTLFLIAVVCLLACAAAQASAEAVLPAGTLLQCTLDEPNFSSQTAEIGDPVLCHIGALGAFGRPVFPRGAYLAGRFQEYRNPGRLFGKGWIELAFDRVVLPDAVSLPVSAKVISVPHLRVSREGKIQGRGHPQRDALGWAIPVLAGQACHAACARAAPSAQGRDANHVAIAGRCGGSSHNRGCEDDIFADAEPAPDPEQRRHTFWGTLLRRFQRPFSGERDNCTPARTVTRAGTPRPLRGSLRAAAYLVGSEEWYELSRERLLARVRQAAMRDPRWERKLLPLSRLDLDETVRLNRERGMEFAIRSRDTEP